MSFFKSIIDFFDHPLFSVIGGVSVIFGALAVAYRAICVIWGVSPIVFRIGKAIWHRKVAIVGNTEAFSSLKECIIDAKIFKEKNVTHVSLDNIDKVKSHSVLLIDWESSGSRIGEIFLGRRNHNTAVVIYARPGSIPNEQMNEFANKSNTVIVNFKGRLLNDILNSLITTSFE